jgi:ADP-heptose:LPS heptosyltransferase
VRAAPPFRRILLARTDRIGDVVLSLPTASLIKSRFPGAVVHFLTRPYTAPLAAMAPDVDAVITDQGLGAWGLSRRLAAGGYDAAVLLHPTARLAAAVFLAAIPWRTGTSYRWYSWLLNRRVGLHRRDSQRHELELNLELAQRGLGSGSCDAERQDYCPRITLSPEQKAAARSLLGMVSGRQVIVHPGSGGSARDWPLSNFAGLINRLSAKGFGLAVTLGPGEDGLRQAMEPMLAGCVRWVSGLDLGQLAAVLSTAELVVSNSTGPLHLAAAVGSRVLGIYCPVEPCLPRRWGPYGPGHAWLMPDVPCCRKCTGSRCRHWDCMESLTVERAYDKAMEMLTDGGR